MVGYKYPRADSNCRENLLCFAFFQQSFPNNEEEMVVKTCAKDDEQ